MTDMLFPGYVTIFKDKNKKIHLYFYPGIDDYHQYYYNNLDLSDCSIPYKQYKNSDNSIEYVFSSKNIIKITCKLISKYNNVEYKTFMI